MPDMSVATAAHQRASLTLFPVDNDLRVSTLKSIHASSNEFLISLGDTDMVENGGDIRRMNYNYILNDTNLTLTDSSLTDDQRHLLVIIFASFATLGFVLNLAVLLYVVVKKLFRNFVSSHFIAHLAFTNSLACAILIPLFVQNIYHQGALFKNQEHWCRFHSFLTCAIWSVSFYMTTSVAGVHLLTFARIHYDQLFGLHPSIICFLSWLIGIALGLPCLTNGSIVKYEPDYYHCLWGMHSSGFKFLAYLVLLGILLPIFLTSYAYVRVLAIFYHAPIVFETLGIFKSRYLIFAILATPFLQFPFFIGRFLPKNYISDPMVPPVFMFLAFAPSISHSIIYGLSIFLMKEDDMALTARSHKATYTAPGVPIQEL